MSVTLTINGTAYTYPSGASDTNWAAEQVAAMQALTAVANAGVLVLETNTTPVGNVNTGEDDLMTYSLPANTLNANAQGVRVTAWGRTPSNANAKTLKMYFGTTAVLSFSLTANQVNAWRASGIVMRTGAATQISDATLLQGGTATALAVALDAGPTATLSGAVTIKCTGAATTTNDIVQEGMIVEFLPAA